MSALSRVTEMSRTDGLRASLQRSLQAVAREERRIASGKKYGELADAPLVTRRLVSLERFVERNEKFQGNISLADSRLAAAESVLAEIENIIIKAREIGLSQIDSTATDETRSSAAVEASFLIDEVVTLGNRRFGDRFLFGGNLVDAAPFERAGTYVSYRGDDSRSWIEVAQGMFAPDNVTGVRALNAWSAEIRGRADLDPVVGADTRLGALNDGRGVAAGSIEIRDGVDFVVVDLSGAKDMGDVLAAIDASGFATATLTAAGNGIVLSRAGADLSVYEVNGGSTARDLGLAVVSAGASFDGGDLDPRVERTTPLGELLGGAGIPAGDFTIMNGTLSATIDTTGLATIEDLLNAIHSAGVAVVAELATDGNGIDLRSRLSGAPFRVADGAAGTAAALGFVTPSDEVELERLNGGLGVSEIDGADLRITLSTGANFDVDMDGAATLGDVRDLINAHPANGGLLVAEVVAGEDRLRLTDLAGGAAEPAVSPVNGSFAASNLGLDAAASGGVLEGTPLDPGAHRVQSIFDGLALLHDGLVQSDVATLERALQALDVAETRLLETRAEVGTQIRRLEISGRRVELEIFEARASISEDGDTDLTEAALAYRREETVLQAALQTGARMLQYTLLDFLE